MKEEVWKNLEGWRSKKGRLVKNRDKRKSAKERLAQIIEDREDKEKRNCMIGWIERAMIVA